MRIRTSLALVATAATLAACGPTEPTTVDTMTSTAVPSSVPTSPAVTPTAVPPATSTSTTVTPTPSKTAITPSAKSTPTKTSAPTVKPTPKPSPTKANETGFKPANPLPPKTVAKPKSVTSTFPTPMNVTLRRGDHGPQVVALQKRLESLGYYIGGTNGDFGSQTQQAVMAFQKVSGTGRDGVYGPKTAAALAKGIRPSAKSNSGHVMEVDKATQTLRVVDDGVVKQVLNASTGGGYEYVNPKTGSRGVANTPSGDYNVYYIYSPDKVWQKGSLGKMYRPYYFVGGIAFHGVPDGGIGATGASHGCVRLSVANMDHIADSGMVKMGTRVLVF